MCALSSETASIVLELVLVLVLDGPQKRRTTQDTRDGTASRSTDVSRTRTRSILDPFNAPLALALTLALLYEPLHRVHANCFCERKNPKS